MTKKVVFSFDERSLENLEKLAEQNRLSIERLQAWKTEALYIMPDFPAIGRLLDIPLGETIHDKILPALIRLKRENELLKNKETDHG